MKAKQDEIATLKERLQHRESELAALQQIAMAVATAQDLPEVLQTIVSLSTQVMGCQKAAIFELDEEADILAIRAWEGLSEAYAEASRAVPIASPRAAAFREGQPLAVADVSAGAAHEHEEVPELARQEGFAAFVDVPLRGRERNLGLLSAYYVEPHEFTAGEIEMFTSFADQAAVALETTRLLRDLKRRVAELGSLEEVGRAMSGTLDLDALLEVIYQQTSRLMDTTNFFIVLYFEESEEWEMRLFVEDGERKQPMGRQKLGAGLTGWIIRHREPLLLKRGADVFLQQQGITRIGRPSRSWLGVPMLRGEDIIGAIAVQSYEREGAYDEGHMRVLAAIARQAAVAIANARLFEQHQRHITELAILEEVGRAISGTLELEEVLERIYQQISRLMETVNCYIALYDPGEDEVSFPLAYEHGQRQRWRPRRGGQGLTEYVLRTGQPLLLRENVDEELEARGISSIGAEAQSWLGVPLQIGDRTIGVLAVQSYTAANLYSEDDQRILSAIARQAAIAVENARTVAEMRKLNLELQGTLDTQKQLLQTIRELSTPVVPLLEGIILLPLVGHIDSNRARHIMDQVLIGVQSHRARLVIVDITGVPVVDTMVAQSLVQAAQAVHLLGAEAVLVGIMPEVAHTMVGLGIDLTLLVTRSDLQSGLEYAVERLRRWVE